MENSVLILDDEPLIRSSLTDYFEDLGWKVYSFGSGEDALDFLEKEPVPFATVDLRLTGMNGIEFVIRARKICPGIKLVIFTGSTSFTYTEELQKADVPENRVLFKPVKNLSEIYRVLISE